MDEILTRIEVLAEEADALADQVDSALALRRALPWHDFSGRRALTALADGYREAAYERLDEAGRLRLAIGRA